MIYNFLRRLFPNFNMRLRSDLPNYGYCIFKHNSNDLGTLKANFQISPNRIIIIYKNTGEYS
jgi:hypothetical protein